MDGLQAHLFTSGPVVARVIGTPGECYDALERHVANVFVSPSPFLILRPSPVLLALRPTPDARRPTPDALRPRNRMSPPLSSAYRNYASESPLQ
jgi:hypothetical protein